MTWARQAGSTTTEEHGWFAEVRANERNQTAAQSARAARTVAGHASDAVDCANLLDMLGLDASDGKRLGLSG